MSPRPMLGAPNTLFDSAINGTRLPDKEDAFRYRWARCLGATSRSVDQLERTEAVPNPERLRA